MTVPVSRDLLIINTAAFLRSFTFGLTGVVLGIYLFRVGLSSFNIGVVVAVGLVGSALATIGVTAKADRAGRRRTLVVLSLFTLMLARMRQMSKIEGQQYLHALQKLRPLPADLARSQAYESYQGQWGGSRRRYRED